MQHNEAVLAQKIIDFYKDKGIDCSVVDERLSFLITLSDGENTHRFRLRNKLFNKVASWKAFYLMLGKEGLKLKEISAAVPSDA